MQQKPRRCIERRGQIAEGFKDFKVIKVLNDRERNSFQKLLRSLFAGYASYFFSGFEMDSRIWVSAIMFFIL